MNHNKTRQELQAEIEALAEDNRILRMENKNMRRGMIITYRWLRGETYHDLFQPEIEALLERAASIPRRRFSASK